MNSSSQHAITAHSNVHYLELVDENPDSIDTLAFIADYLLKEFSSECQNGYVILVGDAKTYQHLIKIKSQYREAMNKLLIFPGDWHSLKNFQEVLLKQYFHSGLKEIAMESGFRGSTLTSLEFCSNFRRTHSFLSQVWEALYRQLLAISNTKYENILYQSTSFTSDTIIETLAKAEEQYEILQSWINSKEENEIVQYWSKFILRDCCAYIQLYLAIRSGNWKLRISSIKQMAPLFSRLTKTYTWS